MSKYEQLRKRSPKDFKRLVGVKEETFNAMIEVFKAYDSERKKGLGIGGRKSLCPEDKVLLMLSYYREYRTLRHTGFDYGVSEATASRVVKEVEKVLIKSGKFSLLGKKALCKDEGVELEYIVIDATACPIQRPKKDKNNIIQERKNNIH